MQQQGGSVASLTVQPYISPLQTAISAAFNVSAAISGAAVNSNFITNYDLFRVHGNASDPGAYQSQLDHDVSVWFESFVSGGALRAPMCASPQ